MTQPTPQTEAGRGLLAGIQQTSDRLDVALNALDYILAIEAQARTEALDVEALAEAYARVGYVVNDDWSDIAREYAAILAAKADR